MVISTLRNVQKVQIQIYMRTTTPALKMNPPLKFKCLLYVSFFFLKKKKSHDWDNWKKYKLTICKDKRKLGPFYPCQIQKVSQNCRQLQPGVTGFSFCNSTTFFLGKHINLLSLFSTNSVCFDSFVFSCEGLYGQKKKNKPKPRNPKQNQHTGKLPVDMYSMRLRGQRDVRCNFEI